MLSKKSGAEKVCATTKTELIARIEALEAKQNGGGQSQYITSDGINLLNYMYKDAIIYQDIFDAYNSNIFKKLGNPTSWDETAYITNPWNLRRIMSIGPGPQSNANGIVVNIPTGYDVLWLRTLNDRTATFRILPYKSKKDANAQVNFDDTQEVYGTGFRYLNEISPDGAAPDTQYLFHSWMPVPIRGSNTTRVSIHTDRGCDGWISGIAFSKNLWGHAKNSAYAYFNKLNPADGDLIWNSNNWNNDQLAVIPCGKSTMLSVPVVPNGKDKIVYIVEHNNNWLGTMHGIVTVNDVKVERFRTSYMNPFSTHINSKIYSRYMATRIPASLIGPNDKFVKLRIDMTMVVGSVDGIYFREIGTHDYI